MKVLTSVHRSSLIILAAILAFTSCRTQNKPINTDAAKTGNAHKAQTHKEDNLQIAEYIRHIFEDKNGHLWLGTNSYGVAHYDGKELEYYSIPEGFNGHQITGITADRDKNIWFATNLGIIKYEWTIDEKGNKRFINYTDPKYFNSQGFWSICADSKGQIWAGAERGIYKFNGEKWSAFQLPYPKEISGEFITEATSWSIIEDSKGHMWFSTNGFGVYRYDGEKFTQYSSEDGLADNSVDCILEDSRGDFWFGTRYGGLSRYDGTRFQTFSQKEGIIENDEVCVVYEDQSGDIWFSSEGYGVYHYDGENLSNYNASHGLQVRAVQDIFQDKKGRLWAGGGGGLYRYDGYSIFYNITRSGPWE